ncbi:NAD(P)/FAD-dependent oxidoreductase [Aspergillus affinis]|uniref:NAD(P)/FAD-dependent oxidoreductase n=1 Tax=Aspergillus affinis TaxID=1070780 RepID=UPI0022FDC30B|nr:FAD/NAD(P)-binding domain-containing protein [Aspergillus affinis]KAI9039848.1 FAD/NAD(P)-binding domain-containing protein [Aspergillus affinis]
MPIPAECTVLVVGGGPGGSYAASLLAREGLNTVLLESDEFPRFHVGESMLPSIRHFFRYIDLDTKFKEHGFTKKVDIFVVLVLAFSSRDEMRRLTCKDTDFIGAGGPENYTWNFLRSESDDLMLNHAVKCGAKVFTPVRVTSLQFAPIGATDNSTQSVLDNTSHSLGRPVSATWASEEDCGAIRYKYLIDATGRAGIVSTKYMRNRKMNTALKDAATWGYWEKCGVFGESTHMENDPYFEAINGSLISILVKAKLTNTDGSGWIWAIPLKDMMSIGVVMKQEIVVAKKRERGLSPSQIYIDSIENTPGIRDLLQRAELVSDLHSTADWSYNATTYASPYLRIVGDAGCFIDPLFSSGVHMALVGALSAAVTICAAERGNCDQAVAADWHSKKIAESYARFLLIVASTRKQISSREESVLNDPAEGSFDRAFHIFQPVIQGTVDVEDEKHNQEEIARIFEFCAGETFGSQNSIEKLAKEVGLPPETVERYRAILIENNGADKNDFENEALDGLRPNMKPGALGLIHAC